MSDGLAARRAAALRLPPLASGRHDPDLELQPIHICHVCGNESRRLVRLFGEYMCRDRVTCYQRWKGNLK